MENFSTKIQRLNEVDTTLFLAGNGNHTLFMDKVMWFISGKLEWIPFYLLLTAMLYQKLGLRKCIVALLGVASLIALADMTCSAVIRPAVCRMRPSCPDNPIYPLVNLVNDYHGRRYGFPSCHGANTLGLALYLSFLFKKRAITIWLIVWSVVVSYSRIYLGVHYPGDILAGYCIGAAYAVLVYRIVTLIFNLEYFSRNTRSGNHIFKFGNSFFTTLSHKFFSFLK